ncbi:hypothetical protein GMB70_11565 [Turicibacter sanguinis]|uniref:hypothetical protein n=1 Tax=Turicibacter sanguinis TaxID=154288 RepID=UPI0012BD1339|nr:hypothetical protein [Turicibacter sanguinis]MCU7195514.1 hypothetical protein [Turicibacter sanguinis]MTP79286.1 hypothetical protein [Turicibacter sanguinis]
MDSFSIEEKTCLNCGCVTRNNYAQFCKECGSPIVNKCTECSDGYGNEAVLEPDAKYCIHCGSESLFKENGLLG